MNPDARHGGSKSSVQRHLNVPHPCGYASSHAARSRLKHRRIHDEAAERLDPESIPQEVPLAGAWAYAALAAMLLATARAWRRRTAG
jgi:hypothetical protein